MWWIFTRKRKFTLEADSSIEVETVKQVDYHKGRKRTVYGQEIVIRENRFSTVRFGKYLGPDALDYLRACIVRETAGRRFLLREFLCAGWQVVCSRYQMDWRGIEAG